jgi:hypothetical protein
MVGATLIIAELKMGFQFKSNISVYYKEMQAESHLSFL